VNREYLAVNGVKWRGGVTFLLIIFFIAEGFIFLQTEFRGMSGLYSIPLNGLKEGSYSYEFEVGSDFFEGYEGSEIKDCNLLLEVVIEKLSGHFNVRFRLKGDVLVTCDRCLGDYYQHVESENRLVVKTGHEYDDSDPDLLIMPAGMSEFDLSQFIYDYSHLALPIRKIHPDGAEGAGGCDPEMIKRIAEISAGSDAERPEWDKLKKLLHEN
jgi:uncharacterized protein